MPIPAMQMLAASGAPQWFAAWKTAYAAQAAGGGQAHIVCFGDSVSQGYYSTVPYYANGWAGLIGSELAVRTGVTPGTGIIPVYEEFDLTDARTSRTGTWTPSVGAAGFYNRLTYGDTGETFTLGPITCSKFRIYYLKSADGGAWTATVDGGTPINYTSFGTEQVLMSEIDCGGAGSHTLVLTGSGLMFPIATEAISNPTAGVKVSRVALSDQRISDLIGDASGISSRRSMLLTDPDLAIVEFGLNEALQAISTATFQANLESLVADLKGLGSSVLIVVAAPPNPATISTWAAYRTVMLDVAAAKKCGVVDFVDKWGTYAANPSYYNDNVHPNPAGHADMARIAADFVVETVSPSTPSAVVPTDIANLGLWLDASDDASFTYSSGTSVSQWNDKSGNNRHFTQATATNQPTRTGTVNGKRIVSFDGSNDWMTGGDVLDLGTSNLTVFAVVKVNIPANNNVIIGKYKVTPADGSWLLYEIASKLETIFDPGTLNVTDSATLTTTTDTKCVGVIIDRAAGTVTQRVSKATNGTNTFTPDSASSRNTATSVYIGGLRDSADTGMFAGYWLNGYLCELVVYQQALGTTDRNSLEAYFYDKWNLL